MSRPRIDDRSGRVRRGPRSLASLLPVELGDLFGAAATAAHADAVTWARGGETFAFRVCHPVEAERQAVPTPEAAEPRIVDAAPVVSALDRVVSATAALASGAGAAGIRAAGRA